MNKIIIDCSTGSEQDIEMTAEEIEQFNSQSAENIKNEQIERIKMRLLELDHIVPRVLEDIIAQSEFSIHPTKLTIIAEKIQLRQQLQSLT